MSGIAFTQMRVNRWASGVALAIAVFAAANGASAQTGSAVDQLAAVKIKPVGDVPATSGQTMASTGTRSTFVISSTIGLGRLDISSLTNGLVQNAGAPKVSAKKRGIAQQTGTARAMTSGETTDATAPGTAGELTSTTIVSSPIRTIRRTTAPTDTPTVAVNDPAPAPAPTSEPAPAPQPAPAPVPAPQPEATPEPEKAPKAPKPEKPPKTPKAPKVDKPPKAPKAPKVDKPPKAPKAPKTSNPKKK